MSALQFNQQLEHYSAYLKAFALNLTRDVENANDLFQETAYRALKHQSKFRPGTNLKAWLATIMKNIFINNYRRSKRQGVTLDGSDNAFLLDSPDRVVENSGEANLLMQELSVAIDKLNEDLRMPFLMHYQGYKYEEIADKLVLPLGTVKSRIHFARKNLRAQITKRYQNMAIGELAA